MHFEQSGVGVAGGDGVAGIPVGLDFQIIPNPWELDRKNLTHPESRHLKGKF